MAKRGRTVGDTQKTRLLKEAEILAENPEIGDIEMVEELKKYGIITTRQTVHADRQKDLESMTLKDIKESKSAMLKEIDTLIGIAYNKAQAGDHDSLRAMDKYDKLFNTKAKVLAMFEQAKLSKNAAERPIINLTIGKPKQYRKEEKDENNE